MKIQSSYMMDDNIFQITRHQFNVKFEGEDGPEDLVEWCRKHCRGEWGPDNSQSLWGVVWFYNDNDAMLFKLTFA